MRSNTCGSNIYGDTCYFCGTKEGLIFLVRDTAETNFRCRCSCKKCAFERSDFDFENELAYERQRVFAIFEDKAILDFSTTMESTLKRFASNKNSFIKVSESVFVNPNHIDRVDIEEEYISISLRNSDVIINISKDLLKG